MVDYQGNPGETQGRGGHGGSALAHIRLVGSFAIFCPVCHTIGHFSVGAVDGF